MVQDNQRSCDVCGAEIPNCEKYVVSKVRKNKVPLFQEMMEAKPELAATTTLDANGNLRLDICLDCQMNMKMSGTPTVN